MTDLTRLVTLALALLGMSLLGSPIATYGDWGPLASADGSDESARAGTGPASAASSPAADNWQLKYTATQPTIRDSMRQLWRSSIEAPQENESAAQLEQAVQALRTVQAPTGAKPAEPKVAAATTTASAATTSSRPAADPKALQAELIAKLKALPATAAMDKVELADALYQAGQFEAALALYEQALPQGQPKPAPGQEKAASAQPKLASTEPADSTAVDKGWLLYQVANCRRQMGDAAALPAYKRLLAECPDSTWAALAASQTKLLEWYQTDKPQGLAAKARSQGSAE